MSEFLYSVYKERVFFWGGGGGGGKKSIINLAGKEHSVSIRRGFEAEVNFKGNCEDETGLKIWLTHFCGLIIVTK